MTTTTAPPVEPATGVRLGRRAAGLLLLVVLVVVACLASLGIGSRAIGWPAVLDILRGVDTSSYEAVVIRSGRVPRTIIGLIVGAALGLAGTVMQGSPVTLSPTRACSACTPARRSPWCPAW